MRHLSVFLNGIVKNLLNGGSERLLHVQSYIKRENGENKSNHLTREGVNNKRGSVNEFDEVNLS